ncbi:hypothetical protein [Amycolatopsis balhimycina]|uniref:hypothetical protein n=1 Tax=Amycolatopsis balhimycina TaxID=208443 RepID=UPI000F78C079|nr:hypothetical protein [Amycolatopsis balhimycina]
MIDQPDGRGVESRERVAYVCVQSDRIRAVLETHGPDGAAPLERTLAALRDGEETTAPLDALHDALLVAGDAAGINGRARGLTPHGVSPAMPDEWVLLCPMHHCSRYTWPSGPELPRCTISGQPLRRERV